MAAGIQYYGTGRRKTSTARVFLRPGNGGLVINHKPIEQAFPTEALRTQIKQPLLVTETADKFDVLATIAGGGIAGVTQGVMALLRAKSTVLTAGVGNPVVATAELGGSLLVSLLALAAPIIAVVVVAVFLWFAVRLIRRITRHARPAKTEAGG